MTAVEVTDLVAGYPGRTVLHEVTARFPAGMVTAVTGPNGSGKSTLLAVLAGVIAPSSGSVTRRHAHRPAFVTQRSEAPDTLPITVGETVAMGRWAHLGPWRRPSAHDRAVVDACLTRLDIAGLAARPLGALSGGQRQRVLVAQGLAQESDLLLLDEPATGFDAAARDHVAAAIREAGVTVVLATHDMRPALAADHCLLLDAGRVMSEGPPARVLR